TARRSQRQTGGPLQERWNAGPVRSDERFSGLISRRPAREKQTPPGGHIIVNRKKKLQKRKVTEKEMLEKVQVVNVRCRLSVNAPNGHGSNDHSQNTGLGGGRQIPSGRKAA